MIVEDIASALKIKQSDYENIVQNFKNFYANAAQNASKTLEEAYEILGINEQSDDKTIKNAYRALVKKYHPDIITGQGAAQNIIDEATSKLQEINEAYQMIKESKK